MKKFLAIVLSLVMVLSMSAVAFASPVTVVTVDSLDPESDAVKAATVETESENVTAEIVSIAAMSDEQKEEANKAIATVVADGATVVDCFAVDVKSEGGSEGEEDEAVTIWVEVAEDGMIYVVYPDGTVVKLDPKDLKTNDDGQVGVTVTKSCVVVIAQ